MPTYDYKCIECDDVFEVTHGMNDTVESCPRCGGRVRRLFRPVGIIFKGSGFYKTDSRAASDNGGKSRPEKADKDSGEAGGKGSGEKEEIPSSGGTGA